MKVDGKHFYMVNCSRDLPILQSFGILARTRDEAGLPGIFSSESIGNRTGIRNLTVTIGGDDRPLDVGDTNGPHRKPIKKNLAKINKLRGKTRVYRKKIIDHLVAEPIPDIEITLGDPQLDNTPRAGLERIVLHDSISELFRRHCGKPLTVCAIFPGNTGSYSVNLERVAEAITWNPN